MYKNLSEIARPATLLKKETLTQVFSCEYCEIVKNTYIEKHLRRATSVHRKIPPTSHKCIVEKFSKYVFDRAPPGDCI